MSTIFHPVISIPAQTGNTPPDDCGFSEEQQAFAAALRARYGEHVAALEDGDLERLMIFFTDDVVWMGAGWPSREGKPELRKLFEDVVGTARVHCRSLYANVDGNSGWNFVDYTVTPHDTAVAPWTFRTSFQWTRSDGTWRCNGVLCYSA
jgi:ketosteroid isomerase-like protein